MALGNSRQEMIEKLDAHGFPSYYTFKFIVPSEAVPQVTELLPEGEISTRPSKNNKYISVSCKAYLSEAVEAVEVYEKAQHINGIISL